ncbi:6322_t:CDS:1, partial [Scutellospora calospora]
TYYPNETYNKFYQIEYIITPGNTPIIINLLPQNPPPPSNTPEQLKPDENSDPKKQDKDTKNDKPNDETPPADNAQPIIIMPSPQYFFIPTK